MHNFGGNQGLLGTFDSIINGIPSALTMNDTTVMGVGITMEGIWQNYVIYDLTLEMAWFVFFFTFLFGCIFLFCDFPIVYCFGWHANA